MKRTALLFAVTLAVAACSPADGGATTTTAFDATTSAPPVTTTTLLSTTTTTGSAFPVTVEADNGAVTIEEPPETIISLSSTATEMLFAVGAGSQVVAVDDQSNHPADAPVTDLSGFTPNIEAILAYEPDLVIVGYEPGDLVASLEAGDVPVILYSAALTIDDVYRQLEAIGAVTGHLDDSIVVSESIEADLAEIAAQTPVVPEGTTYYHELDNALFSATSTTFFGQIYGMFGLENIADAADEDGSSFGYPQLSAEFIVGADPDLIFLADALYGESAATLAARPGWGSLRAVQDGHVVELDSDVASRWGPRIVDFARSVSEAVTAFVSTG
jgi:iron complex transport system substrate-binding protein